MQTRQDWCQEVPDATVRTSGRRPRSVGVFRAWAQLSGSVAALAAVAVLLPNPLHWIELLNVRPLGEDVSSVLGAALVLVTAVVVWFLLLWGSTVMVVALAGRLPGGAGRRCRSMLVRIAPGVARNLVLTAVGASIITGLAAVGTGAASAESVPAGGPAQASSWTSVEGSAVQLRSGQADPGSQTPDPMGISKASALRLDIDWPAGPVQAPPTPENPVDIDWPNAGRPVISAVPAPVPPASSPAVMPPTVVHRGDSLWSIAAHHLPANATDAQIQTASHQWFVANAAVIGHDPNLILPGQILQAPNQETGQRS